MPFPTWIGEFRTNPEIRILIPAGGGPAGNAAGPSGRVPAVCDESAAPLAAGLSSIGRVRRKARVKAAAEAQAYLVQASARFSPTMSLMPRIASIGQRSRAARYTPPDSISIARRLRAVWSQGISSSGSFTSRSLEAIGPAAYAGARAIVSGP